MTQSLIFFLLGAMLTMGPAQAQSRHTPVSFNAPVDPTFTPQQKALSLRAGKKPARVVFNARTGTLVAGKEIRVHAAAISHGHLQVIIRESGKIHPSGMPGGSKTAVTAAGEIVMHRGAGQKTIFSTSTHLRSIVDTLNSLGTSPNDTLAILQALKEAGALDAELMVI